MRLGKALLVLFVLVHAAGARWASAQSPDGILHTNEPLPSAVIADLQAYGLENLAVSVGSEVVATFEYRLARSPAAGVCRLLAAMRRTAPLQPVTVVLQHAGVSTLALGFEPVPLAGPPDAATLQATASSGCDGYRIASSSLDGTPSAEPLGAENAPDPPMLDVVVGTHYGFRWGAGWDVVELHAALAPRLNLRLWRGMEVSTEVLLPLWNEWPGETGHVRPGMVTVSQLVRLPHATFARVAAGKFSSGRFGADVQLRTYVKDGRLAFGVDAGHTVGMRFPNGSLLLDPAGRSVLLGNLGAFVPRYDLFLGLTGGQFLYGDLGARVSVVRRFGGVDVGFSMTGTERGRNTGFHVVLPLLRGRALGHRHVRLRPDPSFAVRYDYSRDRLAGERYDTGMDLDEILQQHHPIFLPHRLYGNE